jgi:uncharacterized membrane protein YeaQ/YmgE (transglycosylase-associated protein family)
MVPDRPARCKGYTFGMPLVAIVLLVLLLIAATGIALTFTLTHLILTLAVAGLVGWLADLAVPGQLPYGWLGAVVAGLVGGWLGALVIGSVGPAIFGVHILPTFLGAAALAAGAELLGKSALRRP